MKPMRLMLPAVIALVLSAATATATSYSRLVVFGDSLSDTGNIDDLTWGIVPGSDYWNGRFSNGPVWIEYLSADLGLGAPTPSRDGGYNYAHGGAETGSGYISFLVPNVGTQVTSYLNNRTPGAGELFVLWAGGNDLNNGQANVATMVSNMSSHVTRLAQAGAQQFLVLNLPPMEMTPSHYKTSDHFTIAQRTVDYNALLDVTLNNLERTLGANIVEMDIYGLLRSLQSTHNDVGLTNIWNPAYNEDTGAVVPNPDQYLFWDSLHPTTRGHELIGDEAYALLGMVHAVPEPATLALWLGIGPLWLLRRRRTAA